MSDSTLTEIARLNNQIGLLEGRVLTKEDLKSLNDDIKSSLKELNDNFEKRSDDLIRRLDREIERGLVVNEQIEARTITSEVAIAALSAKQESLSADTEKLKHQLFGNGDVGVDETVRLIETRVKKLEERQDRDERLMRTIDTMITPLWEHGEWIVSGTLTIWGTIDALNAHLVQQLTQTEVLLSFLPQFGVAIAASLFIILKRKASGKSNGKNSDSAGPGGKDTGD